QLSCVDWLVWRCGMSRNTAHEKRRVARELERRPTVRQRFASGALSYSKVRAITRVVGADEDADRWLLELADSGTTADLERAARHFEQLREQERGVDDYLRRYDRRGFRTSRTFDGMMVIEQVVPVEEGEEYLAHLEAAGDFSAENSSTAQRRADAAMALARAGRASLDKPGHVDRYTVHVVADLDALLMGIGRAELIDGTPIAIETLRRMACDSGIVRHLLKGGSEPRNHAGEGAEHDRSTDDLGGHDLLAEERGRTRHGDDGDQQREQRGQHDRCLGVGPVDEEVAEAAGAEAQAEDDRPAAGVGN